ncbi:MAG: PPC domain-containing DNA-binding protein [bacterium]
MTIFALKNKDKVVEKLTKYVEKNNIKSGVLLALGALEQADLMIYNLKTKKYLSKHLEGPIEVTNFIAVIGKDPEGNCHIHPHITLCDKSFKSFGGHLKEAVVGATLEVVVIESDQAIERYADSEIGLNLIS